MDEHETDVERMMRQSEEERLILIKKKVEAFQPLNERVHTTLKGGMWKRGIIITIKPDFFLLNETLEGILPVFFQEVSKIEKYIQKEKKEEAQV